MVKAGIGKFQTEGILPVDAALYRLCGLAVRQSFGKLHHQRQCQLPGRMCGLASAGKEVGKLRIRIESAELIAHFHIDVAFGEGGLGNLDGQRRNSRLVLGL